jgi:hypothetical protein
MSYDLVYNRKKYNMDNIFATISDQDLELTINSQTQETHHEQEE